MKKKQEIEIGNYDVDGFCRAHHISKAFFYLLAKQGQGPRITKIGRRTLISREAAAEWRAKMEAESNPALGGIHG